MPDNKFFDFNSFKKKSFDQPAREDTLHRLHVKSVHKNRQCHTTRNQTKRSTMPASGNASPHGQSSRKRSPPPPSQEAEREHGKRSRKMCTEQQALCAQKALRAFYFKHICVLASKRLACRFKELTGLTSDAAKSLRCHFLLPFVLCYCSFKFGYLSNGYPSKVPLEVELIYLVQSVHQIYLLDVQRLN